MLNYLCTKIGGVLGKPEFISFPGDAISGYITDYAALRKQ